MPLYEYECEACALRFEVIRKFSDPPLEECTACGGKVRKLLSSPAIQFKGSGWYITDYARKGEGKTAEGSTGSATSGSPGSTSSGSDSPGSSSSGSDSGSSSGSKPKASGSSTS